MKEFTGKHMLTIMLLAFGTIITVNMTLAVFAAHSWTGLVVKNSYVASQNYNKVLADDERQKRLGWTSKLDQTKTHIVFSLNNKDDKLIKLTNVQAKFGRPTNEQQDHIVTFYAQENGHYMAQKKLSAGLWDVQILAKPKSGQNYRQDFRITITDSQ